MREPQVRAWSSRLRLSLSATGTPASGPGSSPAASRRSISAARSRASSSKNSRYAAISGSTRAVRARQDSSTSTAETSRARTWAPVSAAASSQSSGIAAPGLDLRHQQEGVHGLGSVRQEAPARQALPRLVRHLPHAARGDLRRLAFIDLELIDVIDDPGELTGELRLFFGRKTQPGERGDFPYIFVG